MREKKTDLFVTAVSEESRSALSIGLVVYLSRGNGVTVVAKGFILTAQQDSLRYLRC